MIKFSKVKKEHIDDIYGLVLHECEEFSVPLIPKKELVEHYVNLALTNKNTFSKVLLIQNVVVGFVFLKKEDILPVAVIEQLFIHKIARGGTSFLRLLKQTETWAKENECQILCIGGMNTINKEIANKLGFTLEIPYYGKELKW